MKLENEFTVPVAVDDAWRVLLDVERIAPCMPGATLLTHDGDEFTGTVKVKVGPIQVTYKGSAKFVERDEATHRAVIAASGREARGSGTAAATVTTSLHDEGGGSTKVLVETDLNVTGRPAQFGRGVMSEVATKLIGQFSQCLSQEVRAGGAAPTETAPAEAAAPPEAPAAKPAEAAAPPEAPAAKPASPVEPTVPEQAAAPPTPAETGAPAEPSAAPPLAPTAGGMTEAAPAPPAPPAPSQAQQPSAGPTPVAPVERKPHHASEVIDLVESAGASVAKRAAPAAAVLLVVAIVWRRRHRSRRRRR